ncbi:MAG: six-cysteine ranthipeptide SCIFF, partial [Lachnospiraceae bacterium]|nr:six-cysteine ranthipeptide SCIFF [Lachnospiraceae bacterium]
MKHIKTLTTRDYKESMKKGGCGECQTSCQSACKLSLINIYEPTRQGMIS